LAGLLADRLELDPLTRNFVGLLADRRRLDQLPGICDHFLRLGDTAQGRVRARITAAAVLKTDQQNALRDAFEHLTGRTVLAEVETDEELLAGVVVEIRGKVYDGSLRTHLRRLAASMAGSRSYL